MDQGLKRFILTGASLLAISGVIASLSISSIIAG
jgi:hypothetical protein